MGFVKNFFGKFSTSKQREKAVDVCTKGNELCKEGKYEEALTYYDKAIELDPSYIKPYYNKAFTLDEDLSRFEEALSWYDKTLEIDPSHKNAPYSKALLLEDLSRFDEALFWYDKTLEIDPNHKAAPYAKALLLDNLGRTQEALIAYDAAMALLPDDSRPYSAKAGVLKTLGKYEEAIELHDKAINLEPNNSIAYNGKGCVLKHLGRYEEAIEFYGKAIELDPNDALAYCNKAVTLNLLGRQIEALECLNQAANFIDVDDNLTSGNKEYISYFLVELLPKLNEFKEASMAAEAQIENLDVNNPDAQSAILGFNNLKEDGQKFLGSAIECLNPKDKEQNKEDAKPSAQEEQSVDELISQMRLMQAQLTALTAHVESQAQEIARINQQMYDFAMRLGVDEHHISKMMQELQGFEGALPFLLQLKERLEHEDKITENIMGDICQKNFFDNFQRVLNNTYLASSVVETEIVKNNKKGIIGTIGTIIGVASLYVPVFGGGALLLSTVLKGVDDVIQRQYLSNFAKFASSTKEMEEISKDLAVDLINMKLYNASITKKNDYIFSYLFTRQSDNISPSELAKMNAETVASYIVDRIFKGDIKSSDLAESHEPVLANVLEGFNIVPYDDANYNMHLVGDNSYCTYDALS